MQTCRHADMQTCRLSEVKPLRGLLEFRRVFGEVNQYGDTAVTYFVDPEQLI